MYTEDLQDLAADKDVSKSCIFDFPDRPPDTLPPQYPPISPPTCYPWCSFDDWPPPPPPPWPNPIIPPNTYGPGFQTTEAGINCSGGLVQSSIFTLRVSISDFGDFTLTSSTSPTSHNEYHGGLETGPDHILGLNWFYSGILASAGFDIDFNNLLSNLPQPSFQILFYMKLDALHPIIDTQPDNDPIWNTVSGGFDFTAFDSPDKGIPTLGMFNVAGNDRITEFYGNMVLSRIGQNLQGGFAYKHHAGADVPIILT